jgi:hypothetical protein
MTSADCNEIDSFISPRTLPLGTGVGTVGLKQTKALQSWVEAFGE